jgi:hypothetical protein
MLIKMTAGPSNDLRQRSGIVPRYVMPRQPELLLYLVYFRYLLIFIRFLFS